jgi:hypothetical protein
MLPNINFNVYIVHYTPLHQRRAFLLSKLKDISPVNWITETNFAEVPRRVSNANSVFGLSIRKMGLYLGTNSRSLSFSRRKAYWDGLLLHFASYLHWRRLDLVNGSIPPAKTLKESWLENQSMHYNALVHACSNENEWTLILEDDAIPIEDWGAKVTSIGDNLSSRKPTWINLNSGAGLRRTSSDPQPDHNGLFRVRPPSTRCAVAYMVNRKFAQLFVETIRIHGMPDWLPIDVLFHLFCARYRVRTYWQEPVTFVQGSESGHFESNFAKWRDQKDTTKGD